METGPLVGALAALVAAGLYAHVGRIMVRRLPTGDARLAMGLFATWWFSIGLVTLLGASQSGLAAFGVLDLSIHQVISLINILPLVVALWALLYYLLYLHFGKTSILLPLTVAYAVIYVYFVYLNIAMHPIAVETTPLGVRLVFENPLTGIHLSAVIALVLLPTSLAAILYGSLYFRLRDRVHRYRIALVSGSFLLWFGAFPVLGIVTRLNETDWWPLASRLLSLAVPLLILAAYEPPRSIQAWLDKAPASPERS